MYTVFSLWDTYRALHPLHTILEPKRTNDFIQTFLRQYEQGGLLPVWELAANETDCMIGNHAIPVIADAYIKGIRDYDENLALEAMLKSVRQDRYGMKWYRELGYVPSDKEPESVSKTLEYAFDNWCVAMMESAMNADSADDRFMIKSWAYLNLFDPGTRFFRAKSNASWYTPFDPYEVNFNYTEANAWQYRFAVQQNIVGLMDLMGGAEDFANQLDSLFEASPKTTGRNQADLTGLIGQYVHGNEPSHHIAYLYNYAGQSSKTQQRVRQIMDEMYSNRPDGLSGNEDCGQMSAWLVFSAMGFYPVTPACVDYSIGTPWFEKITLNLDSGKKFVIRAPGVSGRNFYIKGMNLSGSARKESRLSHDEITAGGELTFEMTDTPAKWGKTGLCHRGKMMPMPAVPFVAQGERVFQNTQTIALGSLNNDDDIYYTLDGSIPGISAQRYSKPFVIDKTTTLRAVTAIGYRESAIATATFTKINSSLRLHRYNTRYSPQYTARGDNGLIDGIRGGGDFRTGDWQGFEGVDLDVVIDLGKQQTINKITAGFMQDENAWIFFPTIMQVKISEDGQNYTLAGEVICDVPPMEKGVIQKDVVLDLKGEKARYVRVVGVSLGQCPYWHKGAGHPCWVFADEILVE
jgi:hypothetical protein